MIISMDSYIQVSSSLDFLMGNNFSKILSVLIYKYQYFVYSGENKDFYLTQKDMFFLTGINPNSADKQIDKMVKQGLLTLSYRKTARSSYPVRYFYLSIRNIQAFMNLADKEYKIIKDEYKKINITEIRKVFKKKYMSYQHTPVCHNGIHTLCQNDIEPIPIWDSNNNKINTTEKKKYNNKSSVSAKLKDYELDKFLKENIQEINPYLFGNE